MRSKSILREALCGFLFSAMLLTAQPAQAQWTVFDPTSYAQLVRSELKRAQEWVQKVQQYQQM
jgi:conjugal transfer/entry exclusion protein